MFFQRTFRRAAAIVFIAIAMWASPAPACMNDTDSTRGENEFRSRYDSPQPETPAPKRYNIWGIAGLSVGTGLLAGCVAVGLQRKMRGS